MLHFFDFLALVSALKNVKNSIRYLNLQECFADVAWRWLMVARIEAERMLQIYNRTRICKARQKCTLTLHAEIRKRQSYPLTSKCFIAIEDCCARR